MLLHTHRQTSSSCAGVDLGQVDQTVHVSVATASEASPSVAIKSVRGQARLA